MDLEGGRTTGRGSAARFRATPLLLQVAEEHGILLDHADDHFPLPRQSLPPLRLLSASTRQRGEKLRGSAMLVPASPEAERLATQVATINRFLDGVTIVGGAFDGLVRQFECGDRPDFNWNLGGRLYAVGGGYQSMAKADRLAMILDGEDVAEVDIRASFLTILHGVCREAFDPTDDPYAIPGVPREVAKVWTATSLTLGKPLERWTQQHRERLDPEVLKANPAKAVGALIMDRHRLLRDLGDPDGVAIGWPELQFIESDVIVSTVLEMVQAGVPSLPVHDSLIVPRTRVGDVVAVLSRIFLERVGIRPSVSVSC
jgi:hypothetical protein